MNRFARIACRPSRKRSALTKLEAPAAWLAGLVLLALCLPCSGCGGKYDLRRATGRVVLKDGTPLDGMRIVLEPTDQQLRTSSVAISDEDGLFQLGTLQNGDGAQLGAYRVAVIDAVAQRAMDRSLLRIHPRYQETKTSGLEITISEDENDYEFVLDPP